MTFRAFRIVVIFALPFLAAAIPPAAAQQTPEDSIYNLSETWIRQDNAPIPLGSLRGRIVVAGMGYTTCKQLCPALVADMMWLEKHLPSKAAGKVRFAFFSFDPVADTPERLSLYAEGHGLDLAHWSLFESDEDTARELAAALGVGYRRDQANGFDHTSVLSVIAPDGRILYQQKGVEAHPDQLLANVLQALEENENRPRR